jgi:hypothetical protein
VETGREEEAQGRMQGGREEGQGNLRRGVQRQWQRGRGGGLLGLAEGAPVAVAEGGP